jgi:hypothetical protein
LSNGKLYVYLIFQDLFPYHAQQQAACSNPKIQNPSEAYPVIFPQCPTSSVAAYGQRLVTTRPYRKCQAFALRCDESQGCQALSQSAFLFDICDRRTYSLSKKCLELWSSAQDNIRITAFLSIRKLATANDASVMDHILKVGVCTLPDLLSSMWPF